MSALIGLKSGFAGQRDVRKDVPTARRACDKSAPICRASKDARAGGVREALSEAARAAALRATAAALVAAQMTAGLAAVPPPSAALLSSPKAVVPRTPEAALRRSIPAFNPVVGQAQAKLDDIAYLLRIPQRKPWDKMSSDADAVMIALRNGEVALRGVPEGQRAEAEELLLDLQEQLRRAIICIDSQDPERLSIRLADALKTLSELEKLQAPGLAYTIPARYADLPRLTGRATVELKVRKGPGGGEFVVEEGGGGKKEAILTLELDGYSSPLTAGSFADLVSRRAFNGVPLGPSGSAVEARAPEGKVPEGRILPIEVWDKGEFEPRWRVPLDVLGGDIPVLPLSIYGAVAQASSPEDGLSDPSQFFIFKFDRQSSGLGGLSFDEGQFSVFAYVTKGIEVVGQIAPGDVISSARLVAGEEKLQVPTTTAPPVSD